MIGINNKKAKGGIFAQAMVEFALVLPILLFVIIGMFEFGRLIFIYSTVVTAAREGARYGSSSNWNDDPALKEYQGQFRDCAGIRAKAQNVDFFNVVEDGDILIKYDHGPGTTPFANCEEDLSAYNFNYGTVDRIIVQVSADFTPMLGLVPIPGFTISSVSARSLLGLIILDSYVPQPSIHPGSLASLNCVLVTHFEEFIIDPCVN